MAGRFCWLPSRAASGAGGLRGASLGASSRRLMAGAAPPLAGALPGGRANGELCAGDQVLLRYADPEALWHVRILLALVTGEWWIVLTPTGDLYSEQISNANRDLLAWRFRGGAGGVPFGILPG